MEKQEKALHFATQAHEGQKRKYTHKPYITHPIRVAERVLALGGTPDMVSAAYLHDVVEDCGVSLQKLDELFGAKVAALVDELTNVSKSIKPLPNRAERKRIDRERLRHASLEAKVIKLVDRIDNLGEMSRDDVEFLRIYATESEELLKVLAGTHTELETELMVAIAKARRTLPKREALDTYSKRRLGMS